MKPTLLILAAGIGSRYGGLKQADGVGPSGEAVLDYSIYDAIRAGFGKVVFVIRRDILDDMNSIFFEKWSKHVEVDYVFQELTTLPLGFHPPEERQKPWGTGHAIWVAKNKVKEPFCVINADDFYGRTSYHLASEFLQSQENQNKGSYCLIGYILNNTLSEYGYVSRAECSADEKGRLTSIVERLKIKREGRVVYYQDDLGSLNEIDENAIVSMNMWGFLPSLFDYLEEDLHIFLKENSSDLKKEFLLPSVINEIITSGRTEILIKQSPEKWFGMTYREDREEVSNKLKSLVSQQLYPSPIW